MPMLAPSVPTDKRKQGGRNYDASSMTDFKKVAVIDGIKDSKTSTQNNRNIITNLDEQRRAAVLYSSLRGIPRFLCSTCPTGLLGINSIPLSSSTISTLSGVTFFVMYSTFTTLYYNNPTPNILYVNTTPLTNTILNSTYSTARVSPPSANSIGTITNPTRQGVVDQLNAVLALLTWNGGASYLKAGLDGGGRLVLTIVGTQLPAAGTNTPPNFAGLFFGDAPNGSTSLGVTNTNGISGVASAALLITEGQSSTTAPFVLASAI